MEDKTVYPRVCGGTRRTVRATFTEHGLSPRVRGNHLLHRPGPFPPGSIPACAGEPQQEAAAPDQMGVYPRVCGGT